MEIKNAYNIWAKQYDSNENKTRDLDKKITQIKLNNLNFTNILELGCGTGKNTSWLLKKCNKILSVDFSEEMLKIAKNNINSNKVKFMEADILEDWVFVDNFYDLIIFNLVLEHVKDLNYIFNQANKYLTKNGKIYICELHPFKQYIGSKAKYVNSDIINELETYNHHISEFLTCAKNNNFKIKDLDEWFDDENSREIPRLISFIFEKK